VILGIRRFCGLDHQLGDVGEESALAEIDFLRETAEKSWERTRLMSAGVFRSAPDQSGRKVYDKIIIFMGTIGRQGVWADRLEGCENKGVVR
jgi:hypothetical protein